MKKMNFLIVTGLLSYCSFNYQFVLTHIINKVTNESIEFRILALGLFIFSIGLGTYCFDKGLVKKIKLADLEFKLSFLGMISPLFFGLINAIAGVMYNLEYSIDYKRIELEYYTPDMIMRSYPDPFVYKLFYLVLAFSFIALIGFLTGYEFPLLIKKIKSFNKTLAFGYFGTLLSSVTTVFLLFPVLEDKYILVGTGLINLCVAVALAKNKTTKKIFFVMSVAIFSLLSHESINQYSLKNTYFRPPDNVIAESFKINNKVPDILSFRTKYQRIDLVDTPITFTLYLNHHFQFSRSTEKSYHDALAHYSRDSVKSTKSKKNILVLGGGDGLLLRELLKYENDQITQIELDKQFLTFCKNHPKIKELNKSSLFNKRITRHFGDAFQKIKTMKGHFDIIYIDFPYPYMVDIIKLYSKEFYAKLKKLMNPHGFIVADVPLSLAENNRSNKVSSVMFSTIKGAGFSKIRMYKVKGETFAIFGDNITFVFPKKVTDKYSILEDQYLGPINNTTKVDYIYEPDLANSVFHHTLDILRDYSIKFD